MHKMVKQLNSDYILILGHSKPTILTEVPTTGTCAGKAMHWAATLSMKQTGLSSMQSS